MKFCPKCRKEYADNFESCSIDGAPLVAAGSATDPLLGAILAGRYQMVEKIGQGGMGAVYKAVHTRMNRTCAIKLLAADQAEGQNPVERFNREAQLASRIDNPHAVVIYDFGETEDRVLYLVMEYIDGESLGAVLLRERTFTPARACSIARQIAEALSAAHALGIVHRDLKPDNVMLANRGGATDFVKVLDFGIAKTVSHDAGEDLTQTGFVLGTPAYMSPEQLSGEKLDARSDIYSLALIVYQMLSGKLPFEGENTQARLIKRLLESPVPLSRNVTHISGELESAVMAGLARNRDDRPTSAAGFANSLQACLGSETTVAGPTRLTEPVSSTSAPTNDTRVDARSQPRDTAPQGGPTEADSLPTVPIGAQITSANDSGSQDNSPSSYVTRQSTTPMVSESSGGPHQAPGRLPGLESAEPAGPLPAADYSGQGSSAQPGSARPPEPLQRAEQSTPPQMPEPVTPATRFDRRGEGSAQRPGFEQSGKVPPQTVEAAAGRQTPETRINPRQGPASYGVGPTSSQPVLGGAKKKSAIGLVIGLIAIGLLLAAGGGVLIYLKYIRNGAAANPPISRVPAPGPTPPAGRVTDETPTAPVTTGTGAGGATNPEAAAHLAAGKEHQKQAQMLAGSGSASSADEERLKAITEYREAIKLQPVYPEARENLGTALNDSGQVSDALDEYKTAIEQYTTLLGRPTSQVEFNYGRALFDLKRYREAAAVFGRALELNPSDHDLYVQRAFALQNAGDYQSAKQDYQQYLSLEPSGPYADGVRQILAGRANPPTGTH
jgi:serine/threonine-protein kinase